MRNEHLNVSHPDRLSVLTSRAERESRNLMVVENQSPNPTHQCELFFLRTTIAGGSLIPPPTRLSPGQQVKNSNLVGGFDPGFIEFKRLTDFCPKTSPEGKVAETARIFLRSSF